MKGYLFFPALIMAMALYVCAAAPGLPPDGQYTVEVTLSGGSGRAQVVSPAVMTVEGGAARVVLVWSSPYYESMLIDGVTHTPVNTDGNSTFEIPVLPDTDMAVTARTVAMTRPHDIDYTLHFDFSSIKRLPNEKPAPIPPGAAAIILTTAGMFAFVFLKRPGCLGRFKKGKNNNG